jgi:hypothetical protein
MSNENDESKVDNKPIQITQPAQQPAQQPTQQTQPNDQPGLKAKTPLPTDGKYATFSVDESNLKTVDISSAAPTIDTLLGIIDQENKK